MIEYLPWSKNVLVNALLSQKNGDIPTLDVELTAKCTGASCIYCDSKPDVCSQGLPNEINFEIMKKLLLDAKLCGLKWVYTCGLGEPLEDGKFWDVIHLLKENDIGLSIFSNGVFIHDINVARELFENDVHVILKMDTFDEVNFDIILGREGAASKIYAARDFLIEAGYGAKNNYTNFAFSIVPTKLSIDGIPSVIEYAKSHGIFASIGELEQAGEVLTNKLNETLGIPDSKISTLKKMADAYYEGSYMRPVCPSILTGIHIDNWGNCIVDEETGLNCKWFLLKEPRTIKLGNIQSEDAFSLNNKVIAYRKKCFLNNAKYINSLSNISYVFGGCGGNPKDIISLALGQFANE